LGNDANKEHPRRVQLRRYPNRRYYDAARSQHLTLENIFRLICDGQEIQVNDSKSGEDITVRVLAQLILEQAPSKLVALPAELLHQIIRSNESLLREFVDKYFYRALSAFIDSQREFDRYLRQALGLPSTAASPRSGQAGQSIAFPVPNWVAMMTAPFAEALLTGGTGALGVERAPVRGDQQSDVRNEVEKLKKEVERLRKDLKHSKNGRATGRLPGDAGSPLDGDQEDHDE